MIERSLILAGLVLVMGYAGSEPLPAPVPLEFTARDFVIPENIDLSDLRRPRNRILSRLPPRRLNRYRSQFRPRPHMTRKTGQR